MRRRFIPKGIERSAHGQQGTAPPVPKLLDGKQYGKVIALRLGSQTPSYEECLLRLWARQVAKSGMLPSMSHETVN